MVTVSPTFTYEFQSKGPAIDRRDPELFAFDHVTVFSLPNNQVLARSSRNGKEMILSTEVINAMSDCHSFRSLDDHVSTLMEGTEKSSSRQKAISSIVRSVHHGGLTLSAREICETLHPDKLGKPLQVHPVVVIITCDRPEALSRLLGSFREVCDLALIERCFVLDDSRLTENQHKNFEITRDFNRSNGIQATYFGDDESKELSRDLELRLPEFQNLISFLLSRDQKDGVFTAGIARNFSLLLSVGRPVIVFDDDTICRAYESPFSESGIEFTTRERQAHFFVPEDRRPYRKPCGDADPVRQHMRCLGLSVPEALNVLGVGAVEQGSLKHAGTNFASLLNRSSRVLITECGTLGDPGTLTNRWLATLPDESRERLLNEQGQLEIALNHRNCWLGVSRASFVPKAHISQVTGIDNRELLPPYFPFERGEDTIFGLAVNFVYPNSVCLNYPWAVPHSPIPTRHWSESENSRFTAAGFPGKIVERITSDKHICQAEDPDFRLKFLAHLMLDLAHRSKESIINLHAETWLEHKTIYYSKLQANLEAHTANPPLWEKFIRKSIEDVERANAESPGNSAPAGTGSQTQANGEVERWQSYWGLYGQSLLAWPKIRREARKIIDQKFSGA